MIKSKFMAVLGLNAVIALTLGHSPSALLQDATSALSYSGDDAIAKGAYLLQAAGCSSCHTNHAESGPFLAGGAAVKTEFGEFYPPNITPDPVYGIGGWSDEDFLAAMRHGDRPRGGSYYPAFPYTTYSQMSTENILAIKAYIFSQPPIPQPSIPHALKFPFNIRLSLAGWKWLNFRPRRWMDRMDRTPSWNRGGYLAEAVTHCAECHSPRDLTGAIIVNRRFAGTDLGPDGEKVPNITPDPITGLGRWSARDLMLLLKTGMLPDGDVVGGSMAEVIENSTSRLSDADRTALVEYLQALPPLFNPAAPALQPEE